MRSPKPAKTKVRNYSFQKSRRLPTERMSVVNDVRIPSMPGSCYHAIICALAESKDQFVPWNRIIERTEKYMLQYGGPSAWERFKSKNDVKSCEQRIRDNAHTLTRSGRDCYGYRLHERGMAIYYFKDGAMLVTGGRMVPDIHGYKVQFPDGRGLQVRYRGTTMTYKEYKKFSDSGFVTSSGGIVDQDKVRQARADLSRQSEMSRPSIIESRQRTATVSIILEDTHNQDTANRFEAMGVLVSRCEKNALIALVPEEKIDELLCDKDVRDVEIVADDH